jgi:hypothetical protein
MEKTILKPLPSAQLTLSDSDSARAFRRHRHHQRGLHGGRPPCAAGGRRCNSTGITASYNSGTGVLSLSGDATVGDYQQALRAVTFSSSSDTPTATSASRTLSWQVTDKDANTPATSAVVTSTLTLSAVNDNPTLTGFSAPVATGAEDSAVEISLAALLAAGNEADVDGQVTAFVVQAVTTVVRCVWEARLRQPRTGPLAAISSSTQTPRRFGPRPQTPAEAEPMRCRPSRCSPVTTAGTLSANPVTVKVNVTPVGMPPASPR